jgi:hypothetical protein
LSADQGNPSGAFHYALCLHYGIGTESNLLSASVYYEKSSSITLGSVRCRRSLGITRFGNRYFSEFSNQWSLFFDELLLDRPLRLTADYVID